MLPVVRCFLPTVEEAAGTANSADDCLRKKQLQGAIFADPLDRLGVSQIWSGDD